MYGIVFQLIKQRVLYVESSEIEDAVDLVKILHFFFWGVWFELMDARFLDR